MNLRKLIIISLLLAIGAVLHQISPPLVFGMKPDFSLAMLFIILIINDDYKSCLCAGIIAGLLAAATTTFPGGQLPNIIDKILTTNLMFLILLPIRNIINNQIKVFIICIIGTVLSGTIFLLSAYYISGLPTSFNILFLSVVLPATIINTVACSVMFNAINIVSKNKALI